MEIDRLIHSPGRLALFTQLMVIERADATWLQQQTGLSWGNLATHVGKLEDAGYLIVHKQSAPESRARTLYELSPAGRKAYRAYRRMMLDLLE